MTGVKHPFKSYGWQSSHGVLVQVEGSVGVCELSGAQGCAPFLSGGECHSLRLLSVTRAWVDMVDGHAKGWVCVIVGFVSVLLFVKDTLTTEYA